MTQSGGHIRVALPTATSRVTLREITRATVRSVAELEIASAQRGTVAPNGVSIAQAHYEPGAWFRAVYADETPVGLVLLFDPSQPAASADKDVASGEILLWRLMIDQRYQGLGFGRAALDLVRAHVRGRPGIERLVASYVPIDNGPEEFYLKCGFAQTGRRRNEGREIEIWITP